MAGQSKQKNKLLVLKEILETMTDDNHSLTRQQLTDELAKRGITCERKTFYDDIQTLLDSGMDIIIEKNGRQNTYCVGDRLFQTEELFILADAISSCKFLTERKSSELIRKLQKLTSVHIAPELKRGIHVANRVKTFNEKIYYMVNTIHTAIKQNKKITFNYSYYDIEKHKRLKHDGYLYTVSPFYLTWEGDNYYLICFCEKHGNISRYRVDRMEKVNISEENRVTLSVDDEVLAKSQLSVYSMYGGTEKSVTFEFDHSLMDTVIDRFGTKVICKKVSDNKFVFTENVQLSPPFWGWLFQFRNKARVISPPEVVEQAKKEIDTIMSLYNSEE